MYGRNTKRRNRMACRARWCAFCLSYHTYRHTYYSYASCGIYPIWPAEIVHQMLHAGAYYSYASCGIYPIWPAEIVRQMLHAGDVFMQWHSGCFSEDQQGGEPQNIHLVNTF
eukprot:TRINITY_DN2914_c2_g1::TRINITY_DN2914_c2_g1_i2::g.4018::m.4018 TRINITY_DN2914_c2_g1::TRINITY_DN2914_c2_g1_i2::g.4018  ORF type:complete len:112 (+),score=-17.47,PWWP/PF00855.12/3.8,PWWP/PF00855.12/4.9,DUF3105/PF11303.3/1.7,DUF3105/PF11303.3/11 TRINITY_DN2914_c2_g1_i2:123-458(+)